jgi:hypothetical protein
MSKAPKYAVYSWRLSPKLKAELEAAARDEDASIDAILDRLVREWLAGRVRNTSDDHHQLKHSGLMEGASPYRSGRRKGAKADDTKRQRLLHEQARQVIGTVSVDPGSFAESPRDRRRRSPRRGAVDADEQRRLREQLLKAVGTVSIGLGPYTNQRVREVMGEALEKKYRESQRRAPRRSR